jgi:hypothetical protein
LAFATRAQRLVSRRWCGVADPEMLTHGVARERIPPQPG